MIAANIPGLLGALLLLGSSLAQTDMRQENLQENCAEVSEKPARFHLLQLFNGDLRCPIVSLARS